jgi:CDP-diacylglycerol---serine O-phosphatidyltransferase
MNLACGLFALKFAFAGAIEYVLLFTAWALLFDFLDGLVARALRVSSPIGKQLDSLADVVSFGVVPGFVMYMLINDPERPFLCHAGFIIPVFAAFRLAKFNVDLRQTDAFYGLPTPANTILILSFWAIRHFEPESQFAEWLHDTNVLVLLCFLSGFLQIMDLRLIALKFKSVDFDANKYRYALLAISVVLVLLFQFMAIPMVIGAYILLSIIENIAEA